MASARAWAESRGYDYRFYDDELFDHVPAWAQAKAKTSRKPILLMADLARIKIAQELLAQGYERTVWLDADLLVFDPDRFDVDTPGKVCFVRELGNLPGRPFQRKLVNNSVTIFRKGSLFLPFYIAACLAMLRLAPKGLSPLTVGTRFLSVTQPILRFALHPHVGLFHSNVIQAILEAHDDGDDALYMRAMGHELHAANLVLSEQYGDETYDALIDKLLETHGDVVNRHVRGSIDTPAAAKVIGLPG